ncbi:MAG TPA: AMP-binding protein [Burkholderiales bacterium]|nr:AMP-binding protein [Burkholderiales bacterium]
MLCPKCHRPLDDADEGVYICCAHAILQWRCTQCAKVSEGFAFPYGRCPHCGGALEALDGGRVDEAVPLEGVRLAFEIELGGRAFYQRAAADSRDPALRDLFGRFALMEGEHMETLSRRYHIDVPAPSPEFRVERAAIFADVESRPQDSANLFRIAIGLEKRAAAFFAARAEKTAAGSAERELYGELAAEEREHADTLATEYERWRAGKPGLFSLDLLGAGVPRPAAEPVATLNAAALLLERHDAQRPAVCCGERTLSRGALRDHAARAAAVWAVRGIGPGDRVAIKLPDGCEWVTAFLGTMWAGAVAVAVNPRIPAPEWQYILDEAGFSVILAESDGDTPSPWRERVLRVDVWQRDIARATPVDPRPMAPDSPAFWVHSSGTSGRPKAVVHAHRFVRQIEQVSREGLGIRSDDRMFASSKLFFSYPQTNSLFAGLKLGATVILDPQWPTGASVAATVAAQRPTVLFSVPSLYRNMLHERVAPGIAKAGVRLCVSAGEALPASVREQWRAQTGLSIVDGYGASETLILVMLGRDDEQGFMPSPGVDIRPLDEVAPGAPTRLMIHAPTLALGYLDRPQAQAETFREGAFCPADLWARNPAGGWRFAGREDSLVKIRGRWVNLVELAERLASQAPGVVEGAAVCVPDSDGVDAVAFFFVAADTDATRAALQACAETLPHYQRPRWLHAVATLPRTPTGKLLRRKLQELHGTLT